MGKYQLNHTSTKNMPLNHTSTKKSQLNHTSTLNQLLLQFLLLPQPSLLVQLTDLLDTEDTDTELLSLPQLLPEVLTLLPQPSPLPQLPTLVPVLPTVLPGGNFVNPTNLQT